MEFLKLAFMVVWTIWVYSKRLIVFAWSGLNGLWVRMILVRWCVILATLSYFFSVYGGTYLQRIPPLLGYAVLALFASGFFCFGAASFVYVLFCWFRATALMPAPSWPTPVPVPSKDVAEELPVPEAIKRRAAAIAAAMSGVDVAGRFSPYDEERQADIEALLRMKQRGVIDDELGAEILNKVAVSVSE